MPQSKNGEPARLDYLYPKTVKGHRYLYFRHASLPKPISLPLDQDSIEFKTQYDACLALVTVPKVAAVEAPRRPLNADVSFIGSTVGHGITKYKTSNLPKGFKQKSEKTRSCYGYALDVMRGRIGDQELAAFDVNMLDRYLAGVATEFSSATADLHRALFSLVWQTCRKFPEFKTGKLPNPVREADKHYGGAKHSHRPWTKEELMLFNKTASQDLQDAVLLMMYTLQRGGDCIKMKWTDFDGEGISLTPEKDRDTGLPRVHWVPCVKPLRDRLLVMKQERGQSEYILNNMWGQPWASSATVANAIRTHLFNIKLAAPFKKSICMHGLRATGATALADLGMTLLDIQAMSNHMSDRMAKLYIRDASQKLRAQRVGQFWDEALEKDAAEAKKRRANLKVVT